LNRMQLLFALCLFFSFALLQRTPQMDRQFTFKNLCTQDLWIGSQGNPLPVNGGFKLDAGTTVTYPIAGNTTACRFWARTGCKHDSNGHLVCQTGDCPLPPAGYTATNDGTHCYVASTGASIGGMPPSTLAEFTLGGGSTITNFPDFYDLSLVDGFNVPIQIVPSNGINQPGAGYFSCGSPACQTLDCTKMPKELQLTDSAGKVYACVSICIAIYNDTQRNLYPDTLGKIWTGTDPATGFPMKDLVCCSCGLGNGGCSSPTCEYGCSPFNAPSPQEVGGKCNVTAWPIGSNGQRYQIAYSSQCPDAYSWQFDDHQATFHCVYPDYEIIFCGGQGAPPMATAGSSGQQPASSGQQPASSGSQQIVQTQQTFQPPLILGAGSAKHSLSVFLAMMIGLLLVC